ncbi:hypothetical protein [Persicirhabdus sediminis]|uniref:Uncharacterized protein n=1 Tax=Persicirhabdus sediminis TaxID=454144 RepID=A0A8J7MCR5_9BACT|nr:hypothetical protein [Persicirhabdus sediminis]MBK1790922.1 hypothetical protein [Persicirhabdus sediminis]
MLHNIKFLNFSGLMQMRWLRSSAGLFMISQKMMSAIFSALLIVNVSLVHGGEKFETLRGIVTETHKKSALANRSYETLQENGEPTDEESASMLRGYAHRWTVKLPVYLKNGEGREKRVFVLRIWDPVYKHFPGQNCPVVEVLHDDKRLVCQVLDEVAWAADVWAVSHDGKYYLYIGTKHRHRHEEGTNVYSLNLETLVLEHRGIHFSKEEILQARQLLESRLGAPTPSKIQDGNDVEADEGKEAKKKQK